jgi:uncharacterized protein (TIGR02246 family)
MPAMNINKFAFLLLLLLFIGIRFFVIAQTQNKQDMKTVSVQPVAKTVSDDETAIRALMDRFVAAFNSGNVDAIMKNYMPGKNFVILDVVPRKEHLGADVYHNAWVDMFSHYEGKPKIEITELTITADGNVAFGYSFQHVTGTDKKGHPVDRWVRVTDGYRKIDGKWLIAQEHISVPVDFSTGKLVPISKP